jgi:3-deoxy-D-manno-octulosonic-acid transferase
MLQLGAPRSRVKVTGDVKLDALPDVEQNAQARAEWRKRCISHRGCGVGGRFHAPRRRRDVFSAYASLRRDTPELRLALAPRHIERVDEIEQLAQRHGLAVARRTQINN